MVNLTMVLNDAFGEPKAKNLGDLLRIRDPKHGTHNPVQAACEVLAGVVVRFEKDQAEQIFKLIVECRVARDPAAVIKAAGKALGDALKAQGYVGHAQRACDLRAILKQAVADPQWVPDNAGLQGMAKAARAAAKPAKQDDDDASDDVVVVQRPEQKLFDLLTAAHAEASLLNMPMYVEHLHRLIKGLEA